ncbi:MAG: glucokinase [Proteobacteria bacterium]|nr:glucokinase [Pseudomonadota bacterium]
MTEIDLLADIGGTNARIAFRKDREPWRRVFLRQAAGFDSLETLIADVISEAGAKPTRAIVAIPGPISGEIVKLTNLPWQFERGKLAGDIGVPSLRVANDLEAVAWSLPHLARGDIVTWRAGPASQAARVVIAPGTGLGVSALAPYGETWAAVPSEGGHALAVMPRATPPRANALWHTRPCWEDLLSGSGLLRIYQALAGAAKDAANPAEVTALAEAGDAAALEAIGFFSELLGGCAGDMAMIFGAKGGCYIAGGVVPALGNLFDVARFMAGFSDKGSYGLYVDTIPLHLIAHPYPALVGLAALLDASAPSSSH